MPGAALDAGTAVGTLRIDGQSVPLTTSLALAYRDRAALAAYADDGPALRLAFAATPIAPAALDGPGHQQLRRELRPDDPPIVLLRLPLNAHGTIDTADLLILDATPEPRLHRRLPSMTIALGERRVLGALDYTSADGRVRLQLRFSAPLFEDRVPVLDVGAAAARASPQSLALQTFEQALRQGAFAHARRLATAARRRTLADLEQWDEGAISSLAAALPAPATRRAGLQRLVVVPPTAWLLSTDPAAPLLYLREEDGGWRVDVP